MTAQPALEDETLTAPETGCMFPDCGNTAEWVGLGHRPCSTPAFVCDLHKTDIDRRLSHGLPFTCHACHAFTPKTPNKAANWRHL